MVSVCSCCHWVCASETGAIIVGGCISGEWNRNWGWQEFVVFRNMSFWSSKLCSLSSGRMRNSLKRGADGALYTVLNDEAINRLPQVPLNEDLDSIPTLQEVQ